MEYFLPNDRMAMGQAPSSSEKALMWSAANHQFMSESGYSTRAPSVCSHDSNWMPSVHEVDLTTTTPEASSNLSADAADLASDQDDQDNHLFNWINSQDDLEMALKAIPDLLKLLLDDDQVVVKEASMVMNQMSRKDNPRQALILTPQVVPTIVNRLINTSDIETVECLMGTLYGISNQKPNGASTVARSLAIPLLIKVLDTPFIRLISYSVSTIHNVILEGGEEIKTQMRKAGAIHHLLPLIGRSNDVKLLSIVLESLYFLVSGNQEAKLLMLEMGGTQQLVALLSAPSHHYPKLILSIMRLLKLLSTCNQNKDALVAINAIEPLSKHLLVSASPTWTNITRDIVLNCLKTLKNLSSSAAQLPGLGPLVANLIGLVASSNDSAPIDLATAILANLTANEAYKVAAFKSDAIPVLLKLISHYSGITSKTSLPTIVENSMCALRHLTMRHADTYLAQEQVRSCNGLALLASVMKQKHRNWAVIKETLRVVRNFATSQLNSDQMRQNQMINLLMIILYDAVHIIHKVSNDNTQPIAQLRLDGISPFEVVESSVASLVLLAKETVNKIIMRDLDCIGFFVQMLYSQLAGVQRPAASILVELASSPECARTIESQPGFRELVQMMSIDHGSSAVPYISAIVEKLQEHHKLNYM